MLEKRRMNKTAMNYFPFSKNKKREMNNRISDADQFKNKSFERIEGLNNTIDKFNVRDDNKKANYINIKRDILGKEVERLAEQRVKESVKNDMDITKTKMHEQN